MAKAKATLKLTVAYNLKGVSIARLDGLLHAAVQLMADEGLMTGETSAEVDSWEVDVSWRGGK